MSFQLYFLKTSETLPKVLGKIHLVLGPTTSFFTITKDAALITVRADINPDERISNIPIQTLSLEPIVFSLMGLKFGFFNSEIIRSVWVNILFSLTSWV